MKSDCLPTKDMQTSPPLLRTDHLDIKDAKCAKKNDGRKISYHLISRLGAAGVQKERCAQKFNSLHKWPNLQSRLELI